MHDDVAFEFKSFSSNEQSPRQQWRGSLTPVLLATNRAVAEWPLFAPCRLPTRAKQCRPLLGGPTVWAAAGVHDLDHNGDDYVAEDNPVRAIDVFVDELDLRGWGSRASWRKRRPVRPTIPRR